MKREGVLFCQNWHLEAKSKELELGAGPPRIKQC